MRSLGKMREKVRRYASTEEAQLAARYRDLYGDGSYEEELDAFRKQRRGRIVLLLIGFIVVFGGTAAKEWGHPDGVVYEGDRLVAIERPAEGAGALSIDARIYAMTKQGPLAWDRALYISPYSEEAPADRTLTEESYEDRLQRKIDAAARKASGDRSEKVITLPEALDDGTPLVWTENKRSVLPLLFVFLGACLYYVYRSRFTVIAQKEKEARESVIRELPEFLHRLVLLLGAGIVLESAFRRAMADVHGNTYFAGQMQYIKRRAEETNAPLHTEFKAFAERSGVQELTRIAGILGDNVERGTNLSLKLREENELLWFERKKQAEEKGRLAETKLTLPLAILLLVLVLVTVSPALFEM